MMKSSFMMFVACFFCFELNAQSINIDMVTEVSGVQDTLLLTTPGKDFFVEFTGSNLSNVSGYQFKITFDGSAFELLSLGEDYGLSGNKNFLKTNGGTITGIFQKQAVPPCDTILDVAYTINGTSDLSVNGAGLLGVVQFRSKLADGLKGFIRVTDAYLVGFNGTKTAIAANSPGMCSMAIPTSIKNAIGGKKSLFNLAVESNTIKFQFLGSADVRNGGVAKVVVADLAGRLIAEVWNGQIREKGTVNIQLNNALGNLHQGFYLCVAHYRNEKKTVKFFLAR